MELTCKLKQEQSKNNYLQAEKRALEGQVNTLNKLNQQHNNTETTLKREKNELKEKLTEQVTDKRAVDAKVEKLSAKAERIQKDMEGYIEALESQVRDGYHSI